MQRTLLLAALVLAASRGAFAAPRPVAHWDVVPFQRISEPFKAGVAERIISEGTKLLAELQR